MGHRGGRLEERHMRVVLLGPPGAGKGTQAAKLSKAFGIPPVATGDIFRANIREGTELGILAKEYIDRGDLVPDEVVIAMVMDRLGEDDSAAGFLLDGFPRTVGQAEALDKRLEKAKEHAPLDGALNFEITEEEQFRRLLSRAKREHRSDDSEEIIRHRLEVYHAKTKPLVDYYASRGALVPVDGMGSIEEVNRRILASLGERTDPGARART
jgi:adenylate kinase